MNSLTVAISLMPIVGWGIMPICSKKIGGTARESMLGTTIIVTLLFFIFSRIRMDSYELFPFTICFCSGMFWGIGQWLQFESFEEVDISVAMPISNGSQLIFTSLIAWFFLGEWDSRLQGSLEVTCLSMMLFGAYMIARKDKNSERNVTLKALLSLCCSSLSLASYISITSFFDITGSSIFFPQGLGMLFLSILINITNQRQIRMKKVFQNFSTGLCWIIANSSLFYVSERIGVGLSFGISQLCMIVSILGGLYILKEERSKTEIKTLKIGMLLMICSIGLLAITKTK